MKDHRYLKKSPDAVDCENLVGKLPSELSLEALRGLGHPETLKKAVRAKCLDCTSGCSAEVRKCVQHDCPLWPFRMSKNPFDKRSKQNKEHTSD